MVKAKVYVTLKPGVLDPQGKAILNSLESLGFRNIADVRVGKYMVLKLRDGSCQEVEAEVEQMCRKLLANPVIEDYRVELE